MNDEHSSLLVSLLVVLQSLFDDFYGLVKLFHVQLSRNLPVCKVFSQAKLRNRIVEN